MNENNNNNDGDSESHEAMILRMKARLERIEAAKPELLIKNENIPIEQLAEIVYQRMVFLKWSADKMNRVWSSGDVMCPGFNLNRARLFFRVVFTDQNDD